MSFRWEVVKFFDLGNFILSTKMDEATIIDMHKHKWPKHWAFLEPKPKLFLILVVITLVIVLSVHVLHLWWGGITRDIKSISHNMFLLDVVGKK
jgi:hypothetical protein